VDPNNSATVYVAWADRVGSGDIYTVHVRRSTDRGETWSPSDLRTITDATNASLAVATGTVGLLYQAVRGGNWETHLELTQDGFVTLDNDITLAVTPANTPIAVFLPFLGDYNFLIGLENEFRGVFSANNTPDQSNFPNGVVYQRDVDFATQQLRDGSGNPVNVSIDPFYFSVGLTP
jgi:hypothetical protein